MGCVFLRDSKSFSKDLSLFVHVYGFLWFLCIDVALFGFAVIASFEEEIGLIQEYFSDTLWVVLASYLEGVMPVCFVFIHIDCLLGFVGFDEFFFCFFDPIFIFQMQRVFKMDFRQIVLGVVLSQFESLFESILICFKVNCSFNQTILDEELSSFFSAHILCNFYSDIAKLFGCSIRFCYP